jgi:hypothetical protein
VIAYALRQVCSDSRHWPDLTAYFERQREAGRWPTVMVARTSDGRIRDWTICRGGARNRLAARWPGARTERERMPDDPMPTHAKFPIATEVRR